MHTTTTMRQTKQHDAGTGGFVLWIAIYAAFMLGLVAFNGGTDFFASHNHDNTTAIVQLTR